MTRYAHGQGVAIYLARYRRGGPLKPGRIVAWDAQTVTFRYADNQDPDEQGRGKRQLLTLAVEEFLQRWLLHVPPPGLQVVRVYGLYAPAKRAILEGCRQALGQAPVPAPQTLDWQSYCAQQGDRQPECCPVCGQRLIRTAAVAPQRNCPPVGRPQPEAPPGPVRELQEAAGRHTAGLASPLWCTPLARIGSMGTHNAAPLSPRPHSLRVRRRGDGVRPL